MVEFVDCEILTGKGKVKFSVNWIMLECDQKRKSRVIQIRSACFFSGAHFSVRQSTVDIL